MKFLSRMILCLGLLLSVTIVHAESDQAKDAIPTGVALNDAVSLVNDTYKKDFAAAQAPEQKMALVRKLLDGAKDEKGADRFVLLAKARDLAVEAGDVGGCDSALDGIAESFDVDELKARTDAYIALGRKNPSDRKKLGEELSATLKSALAEDRFDVAKSLAEAAQSNAWSGNDVALTKLATSDMQAMHETEKAYTEVKKSLLVLVEKPSDPDANLKVGKYRCFFKGDWDKGLPMLALGSDATLKTLAERDLVGVTVADEQVKLGDDWWDVGDKLKGTAKNNVQLRADKWYTAALPGVKGLARARIEARIAMLQFPAIATKGDLTWKVIFAGFPNDLRPDDFNYVSVSISPGDPLAEYTTQIVSRDKAAALPEAFEERTKNGVNEHWQVYIYTDDEKFSKAKHWFNETYSKTLQGKKFTETVTLGYGSGPNDKGRINQCRIIDGSSASVIFTQTFDEKRFPGGKKITLSGTITDANWGGIGGDAVGTKHVNGSYMPIYITIEDVT